MSTTSIRSVRHWSLVPSSRTGFVCLCTLLRLHLVLGIPESASSVRQHQQPIHYRQPSEQRLIQHLLRGYDTDARGVSGNASETIRVEIQLLLLRIQGLDERSQVLTSTGLIICDWNDSRLRWRAEDYDNLSDVVVRPERIWLPELALMNGAQELAPDFKKVRVMLRHDGHVHWEPGGVFTTTCDIDIRYFPFDDQSCPIQFGAWAYYSARMNITNAGPDVQTQGFRLNGEWEIYRTKAEWKENVLPCCPDTRYPYVEFTLYLRRRHVFYVMNIIVPCTLLSVLVMIVFCLPPEAGEKISLGISVLLAFSVFLLMVAENIPRTSLRVPIIVIYLTSTMGLGTLSVCLTVLVLNLHYRDPERRMPGWMRVFLLVYLSRFVGGLNSRERRRREAYEMSLSSNGDRRSRGETSYRPSHCPDHQRHERHRCHADGVAPKSAKVGLRRSSSVDRGLRYGRLNHAIGLSQQFGVSGDLDLDPSSRIALLFESPLQATGGGGRYSDMSDNDMTSRYGCSGNRSSRAASSRCLFASSVDQLTASAANGSSSSAAAAADAAAATGCRHCGRAAATRSSTGGERRRRIDTGPIRGGGGPRPSSARAWSLGTSGGRGGGSYDWSAKNGRSNRSSNGRCELCFRCHRVLDDDGDDVNEATATYTEWKDAAKVLDRLFFWIVFLAMTASALIILLVPFYKADNHETAHEQSEQL